MCKKDNIIFLLVGKSGSGKTTIENILKEKYHLKGVPSYTTRKPRYKGEKSHIFVSEKEFELLKPNLVAYTYFGGNHYGATKEQVDNANIYVIDVKGIEYMKKRYKELKGNKEIHVIYLYTPFIPRLIRLIKRDGLKNAIKRVWIDHQMFKGISSLKGGDKSLKYSTYKKTPEEVADKVARAYAHTNHKKEQWKSFEQWLHDFPYSSEFVDD